MDVLWSWLLFRNPAVVEYTQSACPCRLPAPTVLEGYLKPRLPITPHSMSLSLSLPLSLSLSVSVSVPVTVTIPVPVCPCPRLRLYPCHCSVPVHVSVSVSIPVPPWPSPGRYRLTAIVASEQMSCFSGRALSWSVKMKIDPESLYTVLIQAA